jgi:hypothetical protein
MSFVSKLIALCLFSVACISPCSATPILDQRQIGIGIGINITIGKPQICADCNLPASQLVDAWDARSLVMDLMFQNDCTIERSKGSKDPAYRTIISTDKLEVNIFFTNRVPDAYRATCPCEKIMFKLMDAIPSCTCSNGLVRVFRGLENCDITDLLLLVTPKRGPTADEEFGAAVEVVPKGQHFQISQQVSISI